MKTFSSFVLILAAFTVNAADNPFAKVEIKTTQLTDNVYMLVGAGGNIGVSHGDDGLLIIDDQFAPLSEKIKKALSEISPEMPTYVLNTHYHGDHTGGNVNFGKDGIIMAHHNVRIRLVNGDTQGQYPDHALPDITYGKDASIHFNGEEIALIHKPNGHTDGDTMVHFKSSNVIHMGDNMFNKAFPYVDIGAGGSVDGLINAIESMLPLMNAETKVIPGHYALADKGDVELFLNMLKATRAEAKANIANGLPIEAAINKGFNKKWQGWGENFINDERWMQTLYQSYGSK